jgi:hypothetical protein
MDINRLGPRGPQIDNPSQKPANGAKFQAQAPEPADFAAAAPAAGVPTGVTPADLRNPGRAEEVLVQCFGSLVDSAGSQLGVRISDTQKRDLLEFLGNDPVLRGKLLNYLDQVVK